MSTHTHQGSPLWIAGWIGTLLAFGVMPITRSCYKLKHAHDWDAFDIYLNAASSNSHLGKWEEADKWHKLATQEFERVAGRPAK